MNRLRFVWVSVLGSLLLLTFQTANAGWIRTYGEEGRDHGACVCQTSDGGYIVTGSTPSSDNQNTDLWLFKTDSAGNILWEKVYGGDELDRGCIVKQAFDKGYVALGLTSSFGLGSNTPWVLKTDSLGDTLWTRTYDAYGLSSCWMEQTSDSGYIISAGAYDDIQLFKTDSLGEIMWVQTYDGTEHEKYPWGNCVKQTSDGGYIITGESIYGDLAIMKTDSLGTPVWATTWGEEKNLDEGLYVEELDDGDYLVAGLTEIAPWHRCICLVKVSVIGDTSYSKYWEEVFPAGNKPLVLTNNGGYVLVGNKPPTLIRIDGGWHTIWTRTYSIGDQDWAKWVEQTSDGGYIMIGTTYYVDTENYELFLIKTDSLGYVDAAIEEPPVTPVIHLSNWQITASIGRQITMRYTDHPQGFHASVFNAAGQKVGEMHSASPSGTITWGEGRSRGVYFIQEIKRGSGSKVSRVILLH